MEKNMKRKENNTSKENMLKNVQGTFAAEGMTLSDSCLNNLNRIIQDQVTYQQVISELRTKYEKRV